MTRKQVLRLRVFAGPNGSGKSTIIQQVRGYRVRGQQVDFGIYINADDIAHSLRAGAFSFSPYSIRVNESELVEHAKSSGLIAAGYTEAEFRKSYVFTGNRLALQKDANHERLAQVVADFLRAALLKRRKKFSFETVFSHASKIDFMEEAASLGYKVYFYFVSTESPEINKDRVALRVQKGGHDVPVHLIESRYLRSLDNMFVAAQLSYQAFFFDNSGEEPFLFAHFRQGKEGKDWDVPDENRIPQWFMKYYSGKVK